MDFNTLSTLGIIMPSSALGPLWQHTVESNVINARKNIPQLKATIFGDFISIGGFFFQILCYTFPVTIVVYYFSSNPCLPVTDILTSARALVRGAAWNLLAPTVDRLNAFSLDPRLSN